MNSKIFSWQKIIASKDVNYNDTSNAFNWLIEFLSLIAQTYLTHADKYIPVFQYNLRAFGLPFLTITQLVGVELVDS